MSLKDPASTIYTNRYTTLTRTVNAQGPPSVLNIANPATNGQVLILNSNASYMIQACFTPTLTTNDTSPFSIYINGLMQPRSSYLLRPPGAVAGCPGMRNLLYFWPMPVSGSNTILVVYTNGVSLIDTRTVAVARIGDPTDSDGDGVPNWMEVLAGTNPYDPTSYFHITGLAPGKPVELAWSSVPGKTYQIWDTTNPAYPMAPILEAVVPADPSNAVSHWFDAAPDAANRYYRIQVLP